MRQENNYLQHHGVKGMKWGVRKDRKGGTGQSRSARRSESPVESPLGRAKRPVYTKSGRQLTNAQIKARIQRLSQEKKYNDLMNEVDHPGRKIVKDVLKESGKVVLGSVVVAGTGYLINKKTGQPVVRVKRKGAWAPGLD